MPVPSSLPLTPSPPTGSPVDPAQKAPGGRAVSQARTARDRQDEKDKAEAIQFEERAVHTLVAHFGEEAVNAFLAHPQKGPRLPGWKYIRLRKMPGIPQKAKMLFAQADALYWGMVLRHDGLIRNEAARHARRSGRPMAEVYSTLRPGGYIAAQKWDPTRGRFAGAIGWYLSSEWQRSSDFHNAVRLPSHFQEKGFSRTGSVSLNDPIGDDPGGATHLDLLEGDPEDRESQRDLEKIQAWRGSLPPQKQAILDAILAGKSNVAIGAKVGLSRERVRQIWVELQANLREYLGLPSHAPDGSRFPSAHLYKLSREEDAPPSPSPAPAPTPVPPHPVPPHPVPPRSGVQMPSPSSPKAAPSGPAGVPPEVLEATYEAYSRREVTLSQAARNLTVNVQLLSYYLFDSRLAKEKGWKRIPRLPAGADSAPIQAPTPTPTPSTATQDPITPDPITPTLPTERPEPAADAGPVTLAGLHSQVEALQKKIQQAMALAQGLSLQADQHQDGHRSLLAKVVASQEEGQRLEAKAKEAREGVARLQRQWAALREEVQKVMGLLQTSGLGAE